MKPHLVIPMSGRGQRFRDAGYNLPKPMIDVAGRSMIERLLDAYPASWGTTFIVSQDHKPFGLDALLKRIRPGCEVVTIAPHSKGPSFALAQSLNHIDSESPVIVSYCDFGMLWDAQQFEKFIDSTNCDACVVSYRRFHPHYLRSHQFAFSRLEGDRVVEIREKQSFTEDFLNEFASCGAYYFRSRELLDLAIETQMKMKLHYNGEFYTSLTVEALLRTHKSADVRIFEIPYFFQWGTPEDLEDYLYWHKTFESQARSQVPAASVAQKVVPMAGLGSRFSEAVPKPLLPIRGQPMFRAATESLMSSQKTVFVARKDFASRCRIEKSNGEVIISIEKTPAGQALTTEYALTRLNAEGDVVVSACDHAIVFDHFLWNRLYQEKLKSSKIDAIVFTVTGYSGAARSPSSFAYVETDAESPLSKIKKISVKKAISEEPQKDKLLVGTFWFRDRKVLEMGIRELKDRDLRVNGELYLDQALQCLIDCGMNVAFFPLTGYINWGAPEAKSEAEYWHEVFINHACL